MIEANKLLNSPLFKDFNEERLEAFISTATYAIRSYKQKDIIALQNSTCQSFLLLYEGQVETVMGNEEGKQISIELIKAPHLLAPAFVFATNNRYPVTIQALTDCKIIVISKQSFTLLMQQESIIMNNFLRIISDRSIFLSKKVNSFALQSLKIRLANFLCDAKGLQKSQQEISENLGVARPSLSRIIAELVHEGILATEKRKLIVLNYKALHKLAGRQL